MNISKETWRAILVLFYTQSIIVIFATPVDFQTDNGQFYIIEPSEEHNWYQARATCSQHNGQLITLNTKRKNKKIEKIFEKNLFKLANMWIGGRGVPNLDDHNMTFYWDSLQQPFFYTQWDEHQPNESLIEPQCVYITNNSKVPYSWRFHPCLDLKLGYICERFEPSNPQTKEHINVKDHNKIEEQSKNTIDLNKFENYTRAWRDIVRKAIRKTQIIIVRSFFRIEHFIAKLTHLRSNENWL